MIENPALKAFVAHLREETVVAQVLICRDGAGFELRQVADREASAESLRRVKPEEARARAQFTAEGEFRPLKSAPSLQRGWRMTAATDAELELALAGLYPGAVADWFAARTAHPQVTDYRAFTGRQSGMYRITTKLTDGQAAEVIRETCDATRCLKRRLWSIGGLMPDSAEQKSIIPCLEPCAMLLEQARKAARKALDGACAEAEND
jgi:sirohydrochlorin cobaltochelatase